MEKENSQESRVVLVTGGTGKIGYAISHAIASRPHYCVVLAARDKTKGERAAKQITQETGNKQVCAELVDVSSWESVQALAARWQGPLHVLINNAAIVPNRHNFTSNGIELQFATNVMGYFWMTKAFTGILKQSAPARVVNIASYWAGDLELGDLEFKRRYYKPGIAYRQSKQACRMLACAFAERLKPFGISVNSCHPGDVSSTLSNNLGFGGYETPETAAKTPVWLATKPVGQQETGCYFEHMQMVNCPFCRDKGAIEALYQSCLNYC
jgi:retinol dehydrogenase 12